MYKLYEDKPALAEQACESSINSELVYRCMQPIKCEHGTFDEGDLVVLRVLSEKYGVLQVSSFRSYSFDMSLWNSESFADKHLLEADWDTLCLPPDEISTYFAPEQNVNELWDEYKVKSKSCRDKFDTPMIISKTAVTLGVIGFILYGLFQLDYRDISLSLLLGGIGVALITLLIRSTWIRLMRDTYLDNMRKQEHPADSV